MSDTKNQQLAPESHRALVDAIESDIRLQLLSFRAIAEKHQVPFYFVTDVWDFMVECELQDD